MSSYSKTSPYYFTDQSNGYLDISTFRDIPYQADDVVFTVTPTYMHRPDLLAYDFYQDTGLWWVFAVRNKDIIKEYLHSKDNNTQSSTRNIINGKPAGRGRS